MRLLKARWSKAVKLWQLEKQFHDVVTTRGPGQTVLNIELELEKIPDVKIHIGISNEKIGEWVIGVGEYFNVPRRGEFTHAITFFFPGTGFDPEAHIDYGTLKEYIIAKDVHGVRLVSDEVRSPDQYTAANNALAMLGETMQRIKQMIGG